MVTKVAINGFGRIGKLVFQILHANPDFEVVAINDLADSKSLGHLLKYDSVHGRYDKTVEVKGDNLIVGGKEIKVFAKKDPAELPWKEMGVPMVVESTGIFRKKEQCKKHISAGAKVVVLTVPPKDEIDAMVVMGVNENILPDKLSEKQLKEGFIVSNASCTTNCLAPIAKVLHDNFGIIRGFMTTIHGYTNDQRIADQIHKDLRRARAAAINIIPTTTGGAKAVGKVIPELSGKLDGMAMRVPISDGSCVDLVAQIKTKIEGKDKGEKIAKINEVMKKAAEKMPKVLEYTEDPIVSSDIVHNPHSSIFDALSTMIMGDDFIKVLSWYDNEWGYSSRVVDLMALMVEKM